MGTAAQKVAHDWRGWYRSQHSRNTHHAKRRPDQTFCAKLAGTKNEARQTTA
jgi:hypothetical protein